MTDSSSEIVVGWVIIFKFKLPYVLRDGQEYIPINFIQSRIFSKLSQFRNLVSSKMSSTYLLDEEAIALTNFLATENKQNHHSFTQQDIVINKNELVMYVDNLKILAGFNDNIFSDDLIIDPEECEEDIQDGGKNISGGWFQVNNSVVPYVIRNKSNMLPYAVLLNSSKIIFNQQIAPIEMTLQEAEFLTNICLKENMAFSFIEFNKLITMFEVVTASNVIYVQSLPSTNPFSSAVFIDKDSRIANASNSVNYNSANAEDKLSNISNRIYYKDQRNSLNQNNLFNVDSDVRLNNIDNSFPISSPGNNQFAQNLKTINTENSLALINVHSTSDSHEQSQPTNSTSDNRVDIYEPMLDTINDNVSDHIALKKKKCEPKNTNLEKRKEIKIAMKSSTSIEDYKVNTNKNMINYLNNTPTSFPIDSANNSQLALNLIQINNKSQLALVDAHSTSDSHDHITIGQSQPTDLTSINGVDIYGLMHDAINLNVSDYITLKKNISGQKKPKEISKALETIILIEDSDVNGNNTINVNNILKVKKKAPKNQKSKKNRIEMNANASIKGYNNTNNNTIKNNSNNGIYSENTGKLKVTNCKNLNRPININYTPIDGITSSAERSMIDIMQLLNIANLYLLPANILYTLEFFSTKIQCAKIENDLYLPLDIVQQLYFKNNSLEKVYTFMINHKVNTRITTQDVIKSFEKVYVFKSAELKLLMVSLFSLAQVIQGQIMNDNDVILVSTKVHDNINYTSFESLMDTVPATNNHLMSSFNIPDKITTPITIAPIALDSYAYSTHLQNIANIVLPKSDVSSVKSVTNRKRDYQQAFISSLDTSKGIKMSISKKSDEGKITSVASQLPDSIDNTQKLPIIQNTRKDRKKSKNETPASKLNTCLVDSLQSQSNHPTLQNKISSSQEYQTNAQLNLRSILLKRHIENTNQPIIIQPNHSISQHLPMQSPEEPVDCIGYLNDYSFEDHYFMDSMLY